MPKAIHDAIASIHEPTAQFIITKDGWRNPAVLDLFIAVWYNEEKPKRA